MKTLFASAKKENRKIDGLKYRIHDDRQSVGKTIRHTSLSNDKAFRDYKNQVINDKRYRVTAVKTDQLRREQKLQNLREKRIYDNTVDYSNRRRQELNGVSTVKLNLSSLENVELDLMNKLQYTRQNVSKVNQEYMNALDSSYSSQELRIANLKQKLQKHRSRYMNVQVNLVRLNEYYVESLAL